MTYLHFLSMPLIGAAIGWFTNLLAVKLIFRPYRPVKLPGYSLQGVVPRRRADLARSIGEVVEKELLSVDDLLLAARSAETLDRLSAAVAASIRGRIMDRLPAFVPLSLKRVISDIITDQVQAEIPGVVGEAFDRFSKVMKETVNFQSMVEERINGFSLDRLEKMILEVAARELRHIEILGGVLGFLIGLVQAGILYLSGV